MNKVMLRCMGLAIWTICHSVLVQTSTGLEPIPMPAGDGAGSSATIAQPAHTLTSPSLADSSATPTLASPPTTGSPTATATTDKNAAPVSASMPLQIDGPITTESAPLVTELPTYDSAEIVSDPIPSDGIPSYPSNSTYNGGAVIQDGASYPSQGQPYVVESPPVPSQRSYDEHYCPTQPPVTTSSTTVVRTYHIVPSQPVTVYSVHPVTAYVPVGPPLPPRFVAPLGPPALMIGPPVPFGPGPGVRARMWARGW